MHMLLESAEKRAFTQNCLLFYWVLGRFVTVMILILLTFK